MSLKKDYIKDKGFLKDNFWLFTGFFLQGSFSYLYHFFIGRYLGPENYGVLGAILSITYLIIVFVQVIQLTVTKMVSEFKAQHQFPKVRYLMVESLKKMFVCGLVISFVLLVFSRFIASFLKIQNFYLIIALGLFVVASFLLAVVRGVLQGLQRFKALAVNYVTEGLVKLVLGIGLVLLGYGVGGALGGIIMSYLVAFILAFIPIKLTKKAEQFSFDYFYSSSFKTLIVLASLTFVYSIDVILVKHFFSSIEAGYYAALSTLGKIIFFASCSVSYVMFSKIPEHAREDKKTRVILYKSLVLMILISLPILLFYLVFPEFSIRLLFGPTFLEIKDYLGIFGVFIMLFSMVYAVSFYNLALNKTGFIFLLLLFNILEVALIWLLHSSVIQIVYILLFLMLVLLITLLISAGVFKNRTFTDNPGI